MMEGQRTVVVFGSQSTIPTAHEQMTHPDATSGILPGFQGDPLPLRESFPFELPEPSSEMHLAGESASAHQVKAVANGSATVTETEMEVEEEKKREREHKKRSKNWTRPETLKLIRLRTELDPRFAKTGRKTELWDEIAESLQKERFSRDAQQCRDKWEKLTAGYKEVRDGLKDKEDNPFYDELYPLLSGKLKRDCRAAPPTALGIEESPQEVVAPSTYKDADLESASRAAEEQDEDPTPAKKRRRMPKFVAVTDLAAVQNLLENILSRQQRFFREMLESMEKKEQIREQIRQEKEEKWRAEERAQRAVFNNAMLALTQKLVGDRLGVPSESLMLLPQPGSPKGDGGAVLQSGPKKRSKNWKRAEVLQLIKLRGEMESKFAKSTRRAALWDEVAEMLKAQGIKRDGKQCREKWDKLMAEYKDVTDGKREQCESHYFAELTAIVTKPPTVDSQSN